MENEKFGTCSSGAVMLGNIGDGIVGKLGIEGSNFIFNPASLL
jgi:hypothetical protein